MYLDLVVEIPKLKTGISRKKIKGTTYIYYEHGRKYYAGKQYTVPQCTSIAERVPGTLKDRSLTTKTRIVWGL